MSSRSLIGSSYGATVFKLRFCYIQVQFINKFCGWADGSQKPARQQAVDVICNFMEIRILKRNLMTATLLTRTFITTLIVLTTNNLLGQQVELFPHIQFDSSYTVIGTFDKSNDYNDTTSRTGFLIDNIEDLLKLQTEWVFNKRVPTLSFESNSISIYTIQDKRPIQKVGLIYPEQGIINSNDNWYYFDMKKYLNFFEKHKIKYHSQVKTFDKYSDYASFGNRLLNDSSLLFFLEPSVEFEGKFTLICDRTSDPSSPTFAMRDINKELSEKNSKEAFNCSIVVNDPFNINSKNKAKITIQCSKKIYDSYQNSKYEKGDWEKTPIDIRLFWKD